jgi:predicted nuclease of restriction endonuclease-like (RecB) superfamily
MRKTPTNKKPRSLAAPFSSSPAGQPDFDVVLGLIDAARTRAVAAANTTLIDLYWNIGEYISEKIAQEEWGKGTVESLAEYIQRRQPGASGFSASNLWRMRQFFETYREEPKLAPLVREVSWTHNLLIMSRCKRDEEREFYLRLVTDGGMEYLKHMTQLRRLSIQGTRVSKDGVEPLRRALPGVTINY